MKIILIGPDCVGKTTMAKILAEKYDLEYFKGLNTLSNLPKINDEILRKDNIVCDRIPVLDDPVYSNIFNTTQTVHITPRRLELLSEFQIYLVVADLDDATDVFLLRGDDNYKNVGEFRLKYLTLLAMYKVFLARYNIHYTTINNDFKEKPHEILARYTSVGIEPAMVTR